MPLIFCRDDSLRHLVRAMRGAETLWRSGEGMSRLCNGVMSLGRQPVLDSSPTPDGQQGLTVGRGTALQRVGRVEVDEEGLRRMGRMRPDFHG